MLGHHDQTLRNISLAKGGMRRQVSGGAGAQETAGQGRYRAIKTQQGRRTIMKRG